MLFDTIHLWDVSVFREELKRVCCVFFFRGGKDREGADSQSRRDCVSCDANGQEDGRPLGGCVQRRGQRLHARGHGEMMAFKEPRPFQYFKSSAPQTEAFFSKLVIHHLDP